MQHDMLIRPLTCYPRALREMISTLFKPQLHFTKTCYTSAYIFKPANESDARYFSATEP
jgi:hypothetical protein